MIKAGNFVSILNRDFDPSPDKIGHQFTDKSNDSIHKAPLVGVLLILLKFYKNENAMACLT